MPTGRAARCARSARILRPGRRSCRCCASLLSSLFAGRASVWLLLVYCPIARGGLAATESFAASHMVAAAREGKFA